MIIIYTKKNIAAPLLLHTYKTILNFKNTKMTLSHKGNFRRERGGKKCEKTNYEF